MGNVTDNGARASLKGHFQSVYLAGVRMEKQSLKLVAWDGRYTILTVSDPLIQNHDRHWRGQDLGHECTYVAITIVLLSKTIYHAIRAFTSFGGNAQRGMSVGKSSKYTNKNIDRCWRKTGLKAGSKVEIRNGRGSAVQLMECILQKAWLQSLASSHLFLFKAEVK